MTSEDTSVTTANPTPKLLLLAGIFAVAALSLIAGYKMSGSDTATATDTNAAKTSDKTSSSKTAATSSFSAAQKKDIETVVRDYLLANPELMLEIQTALDTRLQAQADNRAKKAIADNAKDLFKRADSPAAGKADGDITVVEFFDYNCGFCKRGLDDIVKLIDGDKNVRVVFKELPILSKASEEAARVALAAKLQGKYWDVHRALLAHRGQADKASALDIAEKLGLDKAKLEADMTSEAVTKEIELVRNLASKMNINGTPHFLVGDHSIAGAPDDLLEQLKTKIAEFRKKGCSVC